MMNERYQNLSEDEEGEKEKKRNKNLSEEQAS